MEEETEEQRTHRSVYKLHSSAYTRL